MKNYILSVVLLLFAAGTIMAQSTPRPKKPKKNKGNHSNARTQLGYSSIGSVLFNNGGMSTPGNEDEELTGTGSTLMTPTGWGSDETFAFVTGGGTPKQPYGSYDNPDYLGQIGFGTGDYKKLVSVVGILNINDMSKFDNLSASFVVSRRVSKTASISAGALHLFADAYKTDAAASYYVAYSQAIRNTRLNYTVGIGSGRFYDNSELDKVAEKKDHGTAIFANVSYDVCKNLGVTAEWTGLNLCMSSSVRVKPKWPVLTFGLTDITKLSGDKPSFYFSLGQALVFNKNRK